VAKFKDEVEFTKESWEYLDEVAGKKAGAIFVMSHIGNWELAAEMLNCKGLPIMLYLGAKHKEQVERIHKEKLAESGVRIVTTSEKESSPFALLEGINFLREGGIVSMTGDRLWGNQRSVKVNFLGHEVQLPDTPHLFALMSGAPLITFFVNQKSPGKYHIVVSRGRQVLAASRQDRKNAVLASAQAYADQLEKMVRQHPFEWYHFESFLGKKIDSSG
jgi:lauroyl/myristoyl acyltransferase